MKIFIKPIMLRYKEVYNTKLKDYIEKYDNHIKNNTKSPANN